MEIAIYSDKHKEGVVKLINDIQELEFGRHSKSGRPDLYRIGEVYQKNRGNFWIALDDDKVVGTIGLSDYGKGMGYLERFYVAKELRRQGLGSKLFSILLKFAEDNKYKEIFLSTHDDKVAAKSFYLKNGFKRINSLPDDYPCAIDEIFYKLDLRGSE